MPIQLIVGLANPEPYANTRHNVGAWWVHSYAKQSGVELKKTKLAQAQVAKLTLNHESYYLGIPTHYMNHSGYTLQAMSKLYGISAENTLIVHDDLDLPPGSARLKFGGGEGGHNGLRSIAACLGTKDFHRLRIGIGHPGPGTNVANYVLKPPTLNEKTAIEKTIEASIELMPYLFDGQFEKAMNNLHSRSFTDGT